MTTDKQDPSRKAFEALETAWCEQDCPSVKEALLERDGDTYTHGLMRVKWKVWQASREQALASLLAKFDQPHQEYFGGAIQDAIKELLK